MSRPPVSTPTGKFNPFPKLEGSGVPMLPHPMTAALSAKNVCESMSVRDTRHSSRRMQLCSVEWYSPDGVSTPSTVRLCRKHPMDQRLNILDPLPISTFPLNSHPTIRSMLKAPMNRTLDQSDARRSIRDLLSNKPVFCCRSRSSISEDEGFLA